jgi:MFS family permease
LNAAPPRVGGFGAVTVPLLAMLASQGMMALALQTVPVLAPEIARVNGVDAADIGLYSAVLYLFAMVSSVIGGSLVLRFGALRVCQFSLAIAALGLCTAGLGLSGVLFAAVAIGFGYGPPTPASSHVLIRVTPAHLRSLVFSLKQTGVPIGGALAGAMAPFLLLRFGLDAALLTLAAICALVALAMQPWRRELDADREANRRLEWRDAIGALKLVVSEPSIRLMALVSIGFSAMQISMMSFYVAYLTRIAGLALETAGLALSTAMIAGIVGRIVWGALADRTGRPRFVLALIAAIVTLAAVALTQVTATWPILAVHALSAVVGAAALGWTGVWLAEIARSAPLGRASEATGGVFLFTFGAAVAAPLGFRALVRVADSWTIGYLAAAGLTLLCCVALLRPAREVQRQ